MGASAAEIPTSPDEQPSPGLRASDAERDEVAARLKDEFVAGRLSHDTFVHRMDAVLEARRRADLPPLVADLPAQPQPSAPAPVQDQAGRYDAARYQPAWYQPARYQAARYQAARYQASPVRGPRPLVDWIRGAFSRVTGQARPDRFSRQAGFPGQPVAVPRQQATGPRSLTADAAGVAGPAHGAAHGAVRATTGLRAASDPASPLSLQFPRGAGGEFSIGRDASCDLAIADMTVSRRHATLERTPDGWLISDLESTNGTRVNGWRVRGKVTVRPGDLISFGNLEAVFACDDTVPPADTPAPGVP
jgi:hypothetical protein